MGAAGLAGRASGTVRAASGAIPAPRPRFAPIAHLAWWDGVSYVVTRPGSRARHLTREIVPQPARSSLKPRERLLEVRARGLSDVLGGYPTISRTAAPGAAAPRTPRRALRPRERRSDHRGPAERKWSAQESTAMSPLNNLPGEPHWPPGPGQTEFGSTVPEDQADRPQRSQPESPCQWTSSRERSGYADQWDGARRCRHADPGTPEAVRRRLRREPCSSA